MKQKTSSPTTISLRTSGTISDDDIRKAATALSALAMVLLPNVEIDVTTSVAVPVDKAAKGGWSYDF